MAEWLHLSIMFVRLMAKHKTSYMTWAELISPSKKNGCMNITQSTGYQ